MSIDTERRTAQHANRNRRSTFDLWREALDRALDALKQDDPKLAEREIEYVKEKLERLA